MININAQVFGLLSSNHVLESLVYMFLGRKKVENYFRSDIRKPKGVYGQLVKMDYPSYSGTSSTKRELVYGS